MRIYTKKQAAKILAAMRAYLGAADAADLPEAVVERDEPAPLVEEVNDRVGVEVEGRAHPVVLHAWAGMGGQWQGREKEGAHGGHGGARTAPSMPLKSVVQWKPISLSSSLSG